MTKTRSLRHTVISIYFLSLALFIAIIVVFTILFEDGYVKRKETQARLDLTKEEYTVEEALYFLTANGYHISFQNENVDLKEFQNAEVLDDLVTTVVYIEGDNYGEIVINGVLSATINEVLISDFASELYSVIIAAVLMFVGVTLISVQYFVFQIVNPLSKINDELMRISEFDFEGKKLDFRRHGEIRTLAESVENIKVSLKSYNKNRESLVSALVHELKSPVATISSVVQLNQMNHEKYDDETMVKIIEENIDTISVITKMSLEIFEKQTIYRMGKQDMVSFISEKILVSKPKLDEKGLIVQVTSEETIWYIDEESFSLIISNLLNNICNYSKSNTVVDVNISEAAITFTNDIAPEFTSGTGKGLKIISSLLNDMNMGLEYYEEDGKYHVIITRDLN